MTSETSATSHVPFLQSDLQLDTSRVSESEDDWVRREQSRSRGLKVGNFSKMLTCKLDGGKGGENWDVL